MNIINLFNFNKIFPNVENGYNDCINKAGANFGVSHDEMINYISECYSSGNFNESFILFNTLIPERHHEKFFEIIAIIINYENNKANKTEKILSETLKLFVKIQIGLKYSKETKDNYRNDFRENYVDIFKELLQGVSFHDITEKFYQQLYADIFFYKRLNKVKLIQDEIGNYNLKNEISSRIAGAISCSKFGKIKKGTPNPAKVALRIIELLINNKEIPYSNCYHNNLIIWNHIDVEHILPRSFKDGNYKKLGFENKDDYRRSICKLGNFTLFESYKNQSNKDVYFNIKNENSSTLTKNEKESLIKDYNSKHHDQQIKCFYTYDNSKYITTSVVGHNNKIPKKLANYERSYYGLDYFGKYEIESRTYELASLIAEYVVNYNF